MLFGNFFISQIFLQVKCNSKPYSIANIDNDNFYLFCVTKYKISVRVAPVLFLSSHEWILRLKDPKIEKSSNL